MDHVSIVIPTFRRPDKLPLCLQGCLDQTAQTAATIGIVIVDNCPDASARDIVQAFARTHDRIAYVHEPTPGISAARNAGIEAATGKLIAFIDDDNLPARTWLEQLLSTRSRLQADAVFGRVVGLPDAPCDDRASRLASIFSRDLGDDENLVRQYAKLGTQNSLFDKDVCFPDGGPFDLKLGKTGGEDTEVISTLARAGKRLAWSPNAAIIEMVPASRLTRESVCQRRYRNGQIRVQLGQGKDASAVAAWRVAWTALGAAQFSLSAPRAVLLDALNKPAAADAAWASAWGGLGKLMWWRALGASD